MALHLILLEAYRSHERTHTHSHIALTRVFSSEKTDAHGGHVEACSRLANVNIIYHKLKSEAVIHC